MSYINVPLGQRIKTAFDLSGFNPNTKENFGAGYMCGLLFVFDLPFAVLAFVWNLFFAKICQVRSIGIIAFNEIYNTKATLGGIMGFVLMTIGIGGWFNRSHIIGHEGLTFQMMWIIVACVLAVVNIVATIKVALQK